METEGSQADPLTAYSGGGMIAFDGGDGVYLLDVAATFESGTDHRELWIPDAFTAAWSPDGSQIAYASTPDSQGMMIFVMDTLTGETRQLTEPAFNACWPTWSPDGTRIAFLAGPRNNIDIFVMNTDGSDLQQVTFSPGMDSQPAWSASGNQIAFTSDHEGDVEIYLIDLESGEDPVNLTNDPGIDGGPAWSPDGTQITFYSTREDEREHIFIMDADGGNVIQVTDSAYDDWHPAWSPDGGRIAFTSYRSYGAGDADLYVIDLAGGMEGEGNTPRQLTFSPIHDENAAWRPGSYTQFDSLTSTPITSSNMDQMQLLASLDAHGDRIYGLGFSSDGRILASGSHDGTIRIWDTSSLNEITQLSASGGWGQIYFSPDDDHIASGDGTIWNLETGEVIRSLDRARISTTYSQDGNWMAVGGYNVPVELWKLDTWEVLRTFEWPPDHAFALDFSPDNLLLAAGPSMGPDDESDYVIYVWNTENGNVIHQLEGHSGDVHALEFSPDGAHLVSASIDYNVIVWDTISGELVHTLRHNNGLYDVSFSPDGALLATVGVDRYLRIWDVATGELVGRWLHEGELMAVAFSPDGSLLVTAGYDNLVYIWGIDS
jgi:WD40 repeat protein